VTVVPRGSSSGEISALLHLSCRVFTVPTGLPVRAAACLASILLVSCSTGAVAPNTNGTIVATVWTSVGGQLDSTIAGAVVVITPTGDASLPPDTTNSAGVFTATLNLQQSAGNGTIVVSNVPSGCVTTGTDYVGLKAGATLRFNIGVNCGI